MASPDSQERETPKTEYDILEEAVQSAAGTKIGEKIIGDELFKVQSLREKLRRPVLPSTTIDSQQWERTVRLYIDHALEPNEGSVEMLKYLYSQFEITRKQEIPPHKKPLTPIQRLGGICGISFMGAFAILSVTHGEVNDDINKKFPMYTPEYMEKYSKDPLNGSFKQRNERIIQLGDERNELFIDRMKKHPMTWVGGTLGAVGALSGAAAGFTFIYKSIAPNPRRKREAG